MFKHSVVTTQVTNYSVSAALVSRSHRIRL